MGICGKVFRHSFFELGMESALSLSDINIEDAVEYRLT